MSIRSRHYPQPRQGVTADAAFAALARFAVFRDLDVASGAKTTIRSRVALAAFLERGYRVLVLPRFTRGAHMRGLVLTGSRVIDPETRRDETVGIAFADGRVTEIGHDRPVGDAIG